MNTQNTKYGYGIVRTATLSFAEAGVDLKGKSEQEIVEAFLKLNGVSSEAEYFEKANDKNKKLSNAGLVKDAINTIGAQKDISDMNISDVVDEYMQLKGYTSVEDYIEKNIKKGGGNYTHLGDVAESKPHVITF